MMIKLYKENNIPCINVVRTKEQVEMLKKEYQAEYVLDSTDKDFDKTLKELATKLKATVALECVAGDMPGRLLSAMPVGAIVISYGQLSE